MNSLDSISLQGSTPRYFNTKQAASYLKLSHQYLEIARHKGGGPQYIKLAKAVRYRQEDLDDWMADHIQRHTAETSLSDGPPLNDDVKQGGLPVIQAGGKMRGVDNG